MARKAREKSISGYYAVLIGGNRKLFLDDEDYESFIEKLDTYIDGGIKAFALIENAACLVVRESQKGIGADIKPLTTSYTRYFQKKHGSEEKLFDRRFASEPIETGTEMGTAMATVHKMCALVDKDGFTGMYEGDELYIPQDVREFMGGLEAYARGMEDIFEPGGVFAALVNKRRAPQKGETQKEIKVPREDKAPEKTADASDAMRPGEPAQSGEKADKTTDDSTDKKKRNGGSKKMPAWLL